MANRIPIEVDEWYHCYNRGVDKRKVFLRKSDYERFTLLLYLANSTKAVQMPNRKSRGLDILLDGRRPNRGRQCVEIGAYSLMTNHVHFILKEIEPGGIARFMQKVFTGYTMYFNMANERTGPLFAGAFKSKHLHDDDYLKHGVSYVHCNAIEIFEPAWKDGAGDLKRIERLLRAYPHSSLNAHLNDLHPTRHLLGTSLFDLYEKYPTIDEMLREARAYYEENVPR